MNVLPNGIKVPDTSDLVDPAALLGDMARSISDALGGLGIGKRQPKMFTAANQTAKASLASAGIGLIDGDQVWLEDTAWWEIRLGGAWVLWRTTRGVSWALAHTGITIGNGLSAFSYHVDGDSVVLAGALRFGTTTQVTSTTGQLVLPFTQAGGSNTNVLGTCSGSSGNATFYQGIVTALSTNGGFLSFHTGAAGGALSPLGPTAPRAWSNGDVLGINIRWRRSI